MAENDKHYNTKWIIAICLTAVLSIVGWTLTGTLANRMKVLEEMRTESAQIKANVSANNIRISVLENKYDLIAQSLTEIKALLTQHINK
jgi:Tfp pilus assembly protein PilO